MIILKNTYIQDYTCNQIKKMKTNAIYSCHFDPTFMIKVLIPLESKN